MTRKHIALSVLPLIMAAGQGVAAAAPGQPGLAVPGDGQPGLSTTPAAPPAPSLADYIPDPPAPPPRPQPRQQVTPHPDTLKQQQPHDDQPQDPQPEPAIEVAPVDPRTLRAGNATVAVPDWIDAKTRDKTQAYLDYLEWQIAAGYDSIGFSRQESDRRAASTVTGGLIGGAAGMEIASVPAALIGCGVGAIVGGVAGAAIAGVPTVGVGVPAGATLGGIAGCMIGLVVAAVPAIAAGATAGAVVGGGTAGALGGGVDVPKPDAVPPLIEVAAPTPETPAPAPAAAIDTIGQQVSDAADTVAKSGPEVGAVVDSLRSAIAAMPRL